MPWPAIGAAVAGGLSLIGGNAANKNRSKEAALDRTFQGEQAGRSMQFERQEAQTQMQFQERMRNTEWQAAVADMEKAGINPALAYSQGGASSPGGSAGSGDAGGGSRASQEDILTPAVSSALMFKRTMAEIDAINAGVAKTREETKQVAGRVTRALEPAVSTGQRAMEDLFQGRVMNRKNMKILSYEAGSSAKQVYESTKNAIADLLRRARGSIGPEIRRRIR